MKQLSIVGKDYQTEEHAIGFYNSGDRMKYWGKIGAFWGGLWGWLFGAGLFLIPGIGHILVKYLTGLGVSSSQLSETSRRERQR